ncbi:hypothetical protein [Nocardia nova]|uniref:hypothetical protein n=1 Tax=Nocardia nova TaxID=37330 RepID=UPI0015E42472|nr:hypothetical protein [Nocardia nova]
MGSVPAAAKAISSCGRSTVAAPLRARLPEQLVDIAMALWAAGLRVRRVTPAGTVAWQS